MRAWYDKIVHIYKGYKYRPHEDEDVDVTKTFHNVDGPRGEELSMDVSPYLEVSQALFRLWVDAGCPTRAVRPDGPGGPLSEAEIQALHDEQKEAA